MLFGLNMTKNMSSGEQETILLAWYSHLDDNSMPNVQYSANPKIEKFAC
jgi:hypothetical protein